MVDEHRKQGLLLVGHGTRNEAGRREFLEVASLVAARRDHWAVEPSFLELATPRIEQGVAQLVDQQIEQLTVMPLLLFAAGHAKQDIPSAVATALASQFALSSEQAPHLGCHRAILELSRLRFQQALATLPADGPSVPADQTLLLLVGRGSRDASATAEMHEFARLRAAQTPVGRVECCFFAMARPSLEEMLPRIATMPYWRVVVQPHLLFQGELLTALSERVRRFAALHPQQQWIVTEHLGPHRLLAEAIVELAETPC